jgi:hypothetical protein
MGFVKNRDRPGGNILERGDEADRARKVGPEVFRADDGHGSAASGELGETMRGRRLADTLGPDDEPEALAGEQIEQQVLGENFNSPSPRPPR